MQWQDGFGLSRQDMITKRDHVSCLRSRNEQQARNPRFPEQGESNEVRNLRRKKALLLNQNEQLKREIAKLKAKMIAASTTSPKQDQAPDKKRKFDQSAQIAKDVKKSPLTKPSSENRGFGFQSTSAPDSDDESDTEVGEAKDKKERANFARVWRCVDPQVKEEPKSETVRYSRLPRRAQH